MLYRFAYRSFGIACLALVCHAAPAQEKKDEAVDKKADVPLVILDAQGKEVKLKGWHITAGTRRVPPGNAPDYLEFREEHSTTYEAGILTLVPLTSLRKLDYDHDDKKKTVTAVVAVAGGKDATLVGTTKFKGINRLTIEGDADLGDLGFASVKFLGGNPKGGIIGVRFPAPQPMPEVTGSPAVVVGEDKDKTRHTVVDLTALYQVDGGAYRLLPMLMFKKTVKIDLAKIASLHHIEAEDKKAASLDFAVTLRDGAKHTLTLLTRVELEGSKSATLAGLLGRVPVGYKLFPAHTIAELRIDQGEKK
jgi:hypothetical protein